MIIENSPQICQRGALVRSAALEFGAAGAAGVDVDAGGLAGGVVGGEKIGND